MGDISDVGIPILGQVVDYAFNEASADNALDRELQAFDYAFNKSNAYNDPKQQRERLERAGFNASAVMSNGSPQDVTGSSRTTPSTHPHSFNSVSSYASNISMVANAEKSLAEAKLAKKRADLTDYEAMGIGAEVQYKAALAELAYSQNIETKTKNDILNVELFLKQATVANTIELSNEAVRRAKLDYDSAYVALEQQYFDLQYRSPAELSAIYTTMSMQQAQIALLGVQARLAEKNIELTDAQVEKLYEDIKLIQKQVATEESKQKNIDADTARKNVDTQVASDRHEAEKGHLGYRAWIGSIRQTWGIVDDITQSFENVADGIGSIKSLSPKKTEVIVDRAVERYNKDGEFVGSTQEKTAKTQISSN